MNNSLLINRFFTRNTFKELINEGYCETYYAVIERYVDNFLNKTNYECIKDVYCFLKNDYPNEYYYKNTLLNKLLLGIHNINTTTALTEIPIAGSKADFILINGKAVVYEIKTPLDNFDRLMGQITDYYKAFTRVVVVTGEEESEELNSLLSGYPVGICVLSKKGSLSIRKEPSEYKNNLDNDVMFSIMRKSEYENVISVVSALPETTQCRYYTACKNIFKSIDTEIAYSLFIKQLKQRTKVKPEYFNALPYELKFLAYFSNYKSVEYDKLYSFLGSQGGDGCICPS